MSALAGDTIRCGFIPLTDCATLVAAHELGFAREEGVALELSRENSWSNIRDKLALGLFDAAHMLAPMPIAMSLGLSTMRADVSAPFVLSVNGNVVGVSRRLAERIAAQGEGVFQADAWTAARLLRTALAGEPLRVGVPWRFSMHVALTDYWLGRAGFDVDRDVALSVIPPPFMAEALGAGEIDAFCVGEPWGSAAVDRGFGALLLAGPSIWRFAPEKALGVSASLRDHRPQRLDALLRALHRASEWASRPEHRGALAEILARPHYVDAPAEMIERALAGAFLVGSGGGLRRTPQALELYRGLASFPWRSQAEWIFESLRARAPEAGLDASARALAAGVFRPDLYRRALRANRADLPMASAKAEGSLDAATEVAGVSGGFLLGPDQFFDGAVFEPQLVNA